MKVTQNERVFNLHGQGKPLASMEFDDMSGMSGSRSNKASGQSSGNVAAANQAS